MISEAAFNQLQKLYQNSVSDELKSKDETTVSSVLSETSEQS